MQGLAGDFCERERGDLGAIGGLIKEDRLEAEHGDAGVFEGRCDAGCFAVHAFERDDDETAELLVHHLAEIVIHVALVLRHDLDAARGDERVRGECHHDGIEEVFQIAGDFVAAGRLGWQRGREIAHR